MKATQYRTVFRSPVGQLTISSDGTDITGLWIENQAHFGSTLHADAVTQHLPVFDRCAEWLNRYFSGEIPVEQLPLAPAGTPFRRKAWDVLRCIPFGQTVTYGEIAAHLEQITGKHTSARAVGSAVARNPISILIPCHRVVGSDGSLTGYAGGLEAKRFLLALEGIPVTAGSRIVRSKAIR
ncbi:MAG TPA: hypothetical protein DDX51_05915 [Clostridiales bacterium]|nr:hypothetical protein [Clostridiales bacterium]